MDGWGWQEKEKVHKKGLAYIESGQEKTHIRNDGFSPSE